MTSPAPFERSDSSPILNAKTASQTNHPIGKSERRILLALFVLLVATMGFARTVTLPRGSCDTAFLLQITQSVATTGQADNPLFPSLLAYLKRIVVLRAADADKVDLTPPERQHDHLRFHAYYILYALAPIAWVVPVEVLWPVLTVASYLGLLFLAYIFLRRRGVSVWGAALFSVVVSLHPSWSLGIQGQIFVDRLFLSLGALFLFSFTASKPNRCLVVLWAVLCALIIERTALCVGVFALFYTAFYFKERKGQRLFAALLGGGLIVCGALVITFVLKNMYYDTGAGGSSTPAFFSGLMSNLKQPAFLANAGIFLAVNMGILGWMALFAPRAFLLAGGMVLPNLLGTIGGAEKTGWATHYHSTYYPFLVWAGALGYVNLRQRFAGRQQRLVLGLVAFCAASSLFLWQTSWREHGVIKTVNQAADLRTSSKRRAYRQFFDEIRAAIPEGSKASVPESLCPTLFRDRTLDLFPIGMEQADYAVPQFVSYHGVENHEAVKAILLQRMERAGYDMANPVHCGSVLVYRRTQ